ncbi:DUF1109 domain-containing protein (plasmid) [Burkholderia thailandensis]|uniref:NrsF family protein n=1 Tax=Burkholderia thailandensis TaxID=57975 RepID=UPI00192DDF48|nr:DUF1109 domain-containing protein [Burkholderia thailandensis]MBS2132139.1 DUF1109 domain-containing protein [Burkholderia thailandensis]QRA15245.1 DUF1109 domain-containing protein [Burkholderia thailandensis]
MDTDRLIDKLAADLRPVRPIWPPSARLAVWTVAAVAGTSIVVVMTGLRPDLSTKLTDPVFVTQELAALSVALAACRAALATCVPGEPRWRLWFPVAPLAFWTATLGYQYQDEWARLGITGMEFHSDPMCLPMIALGSAVALIAILWALRRGARLYPRCALLWGSLASTALGSVGLRLFHMEDAALMVIVWQLGSVLLLVVLAVLSKRFLLPP